MEKIEQLFKEGLESIKITIKQEQYALFLIYLKELKQWNEKFNLTAIIKEEEIIVKHFIDSLSCVAAFPLGLVEDSVHQAEAFKILDVGSGAGFPGIPLKIYMPKIKLFLLESSVKKSMFLSHVCKTLQLQGVSIIRNRAETSGQETEHREKYDIVVARALGKISTLVEYCLPFVKINGIMIAQKAREIDREINEAKNAISILGGAIKEVKKINLKSGNEQLERNLIVIDKLYATPDKYPRKPGMPNKRPLE